MISTFGGTTPPLPGAGLPLSSGLLARPLPELVLDPAPSSGSSLSLSLSLSPISDFATPTQAFAHRRACRSRHQRRIQPSAILTAVDTLYLVDIWYLSVSVMYFSIHNDKYQCNKHSDWRNDFRDHPSLYHHNTKSLAFYTHLEGTR